MRPQSDEPCINCTQWSNKVGCKQGEYDSTAMLIFGYCYLAKQYAKKEPTK